MYCGFGAWQADFAVQRRFRFTERMTVRFRGEFFNIFNHPNFGPPDNKITDALFGYSTATLTSSLGSGRPNGDLSPLYQIGGPRLIQLALKFNFEPGNTQSRVLWSVLIGRGPGLK